jgi:hypothetical protein
MERLVKSDQKKKLGCLEGFYRVKRLVLGGLGENEEGRELGLFLQFPTWISIQLRWETHLKCLVLNDYVICE